jgi:hypothetical protein
VNKTQDYKILTADRHLSLEAKVRAALAAGWELHGPTDIIDQGHTILYCQPVKKVGIEPWPEALPIVGPWD